MNARARPAAVQPMKTPPRPHGGDARKWDKPKTDTSQRTAATATTTTTMKSSPRKPVQSPAAAASNRRNRKERKLALQQDVDKLKKRLRHEENVHRALERAFTRPLGALPRLPPYLPPQMLELLAEVAVLEEEVVRLEEQVVNCRQGLYQEAIYISSSKKVVAEPAALQLSPCSATNSTGNSKESSQSGSSEASVSSSEPQFSPPSKMRLDRGSDGTKITRIGVVGRSPVKKNDSWGKDSNFNHQDGGAKSTIKLQLQLQSPQKKVTKTSKPTTEMPNLQKQPKEAIVAHESSPNRISEDLLGCLVTIFSSINTPQNMETELEMAPSISGANGDSKLTTSQDPYHICLQFGERDVGPYMQFLSVDINSIDLSLTSNYPCLLRKLKLFLRKLETVDLRGLNHQQKLAFWINIYNSCMMNAFLEHGIPATPHMIVALMQKAMINVGGHLLSAMTIEHFILRLPYNFKSALPKSSKNDEVGTRSILGLDWPEPLVTYALSCGSWSSPAVRVYSASNVETELQSAKCDYLQAAVGISRTKMFAIPKLLDWYLLDFAKDAESLVDWICLQLPAELRKEAIKCIEQARRAQCTSPILQILPYDFKFRYLLAI